jgi:hypothetical protein
MKCSICGVEAGNIDEMITQNWINSFFEGDDEHGPICPSCKQSLTFIASDGEYELRDEFRGKMIYNDQIDKFEDEDPMSDVVLGFILN